MAALGGIPNGFPAESEGGGLARGDPQHTIPLENAPPTGAQVWGGVRPEHLKVDVGRGEGTGIGTGRVTQRTSDGLLTTLTIAWAGHALRTHLVAGRGLARELSPGDTVSLAGRGDELHVLSLIHI